VIGSDFTGGVLPTGTVNFAAGVATATIAINVAGDTVFEPNEDFTVSLNTPVNATLGTSVNTTGTINNDDVTSANHAPTARDQTFTIDANVVKTLTVADFGFKDADAGDKLQSITVNWLPSTGHLTLGGAAVAVNQVIKTAEISAGTLSFV
jgi:hypothetical protein